MKRSQKHCSAFIFFPSFNYCWADCGLFSFSFFSKIGEYHIETKRNVVIKISPASENPAFLPLFSSPSSDRKLGDKQNTKRVRLISFLYFGVGRLFSLSFLSFRGFVGKMFSLQLSDFVISVQAGVSDSGPGEPQHRRNVSTFLTPNYTHERQ